MAPPIIRCIRGVAPNGRDIRIDVEAVGSTNFKTMRDLRLGLAPFIESRTGVNRAEVEILVE